MSEHEKTLKLVTNLDRGAIEKRLVEARSAAQAAGLTDLAKMLGGVEGAPKAQIEQKVKGALKSLAGKSDGKNILALLELVELNLPNLK
jgi:hypothetical protein